MLREMSTRSASRRFSTVAMQKKMKSDDDSDFMEALQHHNLNLQNQKKDENENNSQDHHQPVPPTCTHHRRSSVSAASPLKRRNRRPTIMSHIESSDVSTSENQRHQKQSMKNAMHDLHFKQAELSRKIAYHTHAGHTSHFSTAIPHSNHTLRRVSAANFTVPIEKKNGGKGAITQQKPKVAWYEALSHDGPGEHMTESEIHISQTSVLHSETQYVRDYAESAKDLLTLHIAKQSKKDKKTGNVFITHPRNPIFSSFSQLTLSIFQLKE
jgi:hypothetical protein